VLEKWQSYLKMNETESLDDASHYLQEDRPDRVVAAIRRVLERTNIVNSALTREQAERERSEQQTMSKLSGSASIE
jgi:hypothetical protein